MHNFVSIPLVSETPRPDGAERLNRGMDAELKPVSSGQKDFMGMLKKLASVDHETEILSSQ